MRMNDDIIIFKWTNHGRLLIYGINLLQHLNFKCPNVHGSKHSINITYKAIYMCGFKLSSITREAEK